MSFESSGYKDSLRGCSGHQFKSGQCTKIDFHFKEAVSVAGDVPVLMGKEQEGIFIDLVGLPGINESFDVLSLGLIELVVAVFVHCNCEVADEVVPVDQEFVVMLGG